MLLKVFALVAIAMIVFSIVVAMQPSDFNYTRAAVINAPPERIFPHLNNLHLGQAWSPWAKLDPGAKFIFSGPEAGVGASLSWDGTKSGAGTMTIIESRPNELVRAALNFFRPMKAENITEYRLIPEGTQTRVSWSMSGQTNFVGKAINLVMNCEKMVGEQFDKGLASLKIIAESNS